MEVTDAWFDGPVPNPLHPRGAMIDPVHRRVRVRTPAGNWVTLRAGDRVSGNIVDLGPNSTEDSINESPYDAQSRAEAAAMRRSFGGMMGASSVDPSPTLSQLWRD